MSENTAYSDTLERQRRDLVDYSLACAQESRLNDKEPRRAQNRKNWDYFHGVIDWSHKRPEDPKIHLHKLGVAAERTRSKFKQQLMKYDQWIAVEREYPRPDAVLTDFAAKSLLIKQLNKADAKTVLSDGILRGCMESAISIKIGGKHVVKPRYVSEGNKKVRKEKTVWQLDLCDLSFEQFLKDVQMPDEPLYEIEELMTDYFRVLDLASEEQSADKPYRKEAVEKLEGFGPREQEEQEKRAEGNPSKTETLKHRKQVLLQTFYGTVLTEKGEVYEWENDDGSKTPLVGVCWVLANESEVLVDPRRNPRWSGRSPYISTDLLRSPGLGRKAIMDAGVDLNEGMDELFNLMLAGALKSVHNVTWYREDWVTDKRKLSGGVKDGDSIPIDSSAPPGADPIGVVQTGTVPQEAFNMFQTADRAFAENVLSNQIDLSGNLPGKQIRATELVQASNAISDIFDSLAMDIEDKFVERLAEECLYEIVQHLDDLDPEEVRACFGSAQDKAEQFLAMSPQERFAEIDGAFKFSGKGLRGMISSGAKAQALINLLNTVTANPITFQAIESQVSAAKIVRTIAKGLGIDIEEIEPDQAERAMIEQKQLIREQALAQAEIAQPEQGQAGMSQGSMPAMNQPGAEQGM